MDSYQYTIFFLISATFVSVNSFYSDGSSNDLHQMHSTVNPSTNDLQLLLETLPPYEKVKIQLYYQSICSYCRNFIVKYLAPTVKKLQPYLDVHLYPYGNADTITNEKGRVEIICQDGMNECYGNKLHACAIDNLSNLTAIYFISCMMDFGQDHRGSDDEAADKCGYLMNIDAEPIKTCASSLRGFQLLKSYGEDSTKADFLGVPHLLINGDWEPGFNFDLRRKVCAAMNVLPPECNEI